MAKLIKTEEEYARALAELGALAAVSPAPGSPDAERLELLGLLIEQYEEAQLPRRLPSPLEAIRFRMDQQDLQARDLIPLLGSRSRVSEVLAGRRALTLPMIRSLHRGLGIPAEALLQEPNASPETIDAPWERFPFKVMLKRGWLPGHRTTSKRGPDAVLRDYFAPLGGGGRAVANALYRQTTHVRTGRDMDRFALVAWTARILLRAEERPPRTHFNVQALDDDFLTSLIRCSRHHAGPREAVDALLTRGVAVVIEEHLPKTWLDGASVVSPSGFPVIGLTLRHDRIDNFWFTLAHELMHVRFHLERGRTEDPAREGFYDDLDVGPADDHQEREADQLARGLLIPPLAWEESAARYLPSPETITILADELGIHPAIVAGRARYERKSFRLLSKMVGHGAVRRLFAEFEPHR